MKRRRFVVAGLVACFIWINCILFKSRFPLISRARELFTSQGSTTNEALLDRRLFLKQSRLDIDESLLHYFGKSDVVNLLDYLVSRKLETHYRHPVWQSATFDYHTTGKTVYIASKKTFHLSFVGDSRIRQLFASFCKVLPNYDMILFPKHEAKFSFTPPHMIVYSELLSAVASYYWFNLLVESEGRDVFNFLLSWLGHPVMNSGEVYTPTPIPDVLVIGIGPHHMLQRHRYAPEDVYFNKLGELVPVLQNISQHSQIIWLPMHPTLEMFGSDSSDNTDVHAQKIFQYNQAAHSILSESGISVLKSASPIVEEYIRSCLINHRKDGLVRGFVSCSDYIHPGNVVIHDILQLLYNILLPLD